jgi:hypothetical protein
VNAAPTSERDLFAARAVLQILSCATRATSVTQLEAARKLRRLLEPGDSPLDHCIELLLICLGKLSKDVFELIKVEYRSSLERDAELLGMLDNVEAAFWGIQRGGAGLGDLMGQFFGELTSSA